MSYNVNEIQQLVGHLSQIFDMARLVDPIQEKTISFGKDDKMLPGEGKTCYLLWEKHSRCRNCISIQAYNLNRRLTKYEFVHQDIYNIVSKPVDITLTNNTSYRCVLEIVSKITDEVLLGAFGKNEFIDKILSYEGKLYKDSLTKVFNRRYFDEKIFCHNDNCELGKNVVFIMADLKKFKLINDMYGHITGDWVLTHTASVIQSCVRACDSVIRMGGDEFLIVLNNSDFKVAERIIREIDRKMKDEVVYDKLQGKYATANFGVSCSSDFKDTPENITDMLSRADKDLYLNKDL